MKRGNKFLLVGLILILLIIPLISAGFFSDWWGRITGEVATQPVTLNITVASGAAPIIYNISDLAAVTLTDGPAATYITVNFSVNDSDGAGNLDNSSAMLNLTRSGEELRINSSCAVADFSGNHANYTCNITLWWYDVDGAWTVYANITDLTSNLAINNTETRTLNSLTGIVLSPSSLTFATITAGNLNTTPSDFLRLNNTGNQDVASGNVQMNATDLVGEQTNSTFLFAGNFSASNSTGGEIECNASNPDATALINYSYTGIVGSILTAGNFTLEDGTAQEDTYLCLREAGSELTSQEYSTLRYGSWTVQII